VDSEVLAFGGMPPNVIHPGVKSKMVAGMAAIIQELIEFI
jgi:hypothetical protein